MVHSNAHFARGQQPEPIDPVGYKGERDRVSAYLGHLNDADREQIFGGTAARVFGFKV